MEKADFIPRRTPNGERLIADRSGWLAEWERIDRQIFVLSDGHRSIEHIAMLLHRPVDAIFERCRALTVSGRISLEGKQRTLMMDAQLLKMSLASIPDHTFFAHHFYGLLFHTLPDARPLFAQTNWKKQYHSLMATISVVVDGVGRGAHLTPTLHKLGEKHRHFGAKPEHYPVVGSCLITTFQRILGDHFSQEMQDAWKVAFEIISAEMIRGAGQGP